jgi:PmbA protein
MHSHLRGHPALQQAIARLERLQPDHFELYFEHRTATKIESKDQEVDSLSRSEDVGLSVRVIRDQKLGFSFTTSLLPDAIERAVDTANEMAAFMPIDEHVGFHSFGSSVYPAIDQYDSRGLAVPIAEKIALAKKLEATCRSADKRITGVRSAAVNETRFETHLVDSSGEHISHQSTLYSASVTCKSEQDGESQIGGEYGFSPLLESLNVSHVGKLAARWATELLGAKMPPTMQCPAVFRNSVVADLIDFLSASFSAEEIDKGRSMLAGKRGEKLFSNAITLIDDGLLPNGMGTSPFDGEGVPSTRTTLIDGGFVSGALYDVYYARKHGVAPTGSASRGIKGPPSISTSNLYLPAGKKTEAQLYDGITQGILITDLMGIHTANPVTGDFSLGASGILIENGKLSRPVRGFAVAGNILEILRRVTDVGNDLRFFGTTGAPSARISELAVSGS